MNVFELALHVVNGVEVSQWDSYDLPLRLAEASQFSVWNVNVIPCWDKIPLLWIRRKVRVEP